MPKLGELALITGDLNVGHRELDIRNWRGNVKKAGFLPRERAYFDRFTGPEGEQVVGTTAPPARGSAGSTWTPVGGRGRRPLLVVVEPRQGVRHRHGLAHRLPPRLGGPRVVDYRVVRAPSWDTGGAITPRGRRLRVLNCPAELSAPAGGGPRHPFSRLGR
jgi:exodeoxyribonuclease-3